MCQSGDFFEHRTCLLEESRIQRASLTAGKQLFLAGLQVLFDAFPSLRGKASSQADRPVFRAFIDGRAQELHLLAEATTPAAYQQMESKTKSLGKREWLSQGPGLKPRRFFAAWGESANAGSQLLGQSGFHNLSFIFSTTVGAMRSAAATICESAQNRKPYRQRQGLRLNRKGHTLRATNRRGEVVDIIIDTARKTKVHLLCEI